MVLTTYNKELHEKSLREEGAREAREEGREEGRLEVRVEIAKKLLKKNMPVADIATCTGLTEEQIQDLA